MLEENLGCQLVTAKNLATILEVYKPLLPTQENNTVTPQPGDIIVIRRVNVFDLFDNNLIHWFEHYWLCTPDEFDQKFEMVDGEYLSTTFSLIRLKD
jgi:hypothetical protein